MIEIKEWVTPVVVGAHPHETVDVVVKRMKQYGIGSVIVNGPDQKPLGIFTERDVLNKIVGGERDPKKTLIQEVMTSPIETVNANRPVMEVFKLFAERDYRHLPVTTNDGRIIGVLSLRSKSFIQEVIRIMSVLQNVNEMKSNFLANVSHELKTPLISITKAADFILNEMDKMPREETVHFLNIIERQGERMIRLISDLLDMAALEAGKMRLEKRRVNVLHIVENAVKNVEILTRRKNIGISYEAHTEDLVIFADEARITQVLINLLSNSIKFTPDGGKICLDVHKDDQRKKCIRLSISDTGIGIAKEKLQVIFERFEQAHDPTMGIYQGTGLGLTIVKEIVGLHSGSVWVESEENKGSTFYISLPTEPPEITIESGSAAASKNQAN